MIRGRSEQVRNVPTDFLKRLRTQIGRYIAAICIAGGGEAVAISCISAKIWRWNQISKNVLENSKIKVARNGRGKVRTSPQHPYGLPKTPRNTNRAIHRRHLHCRWWWSCGNQLHFWFHLQILAEMQLITANSPPPAMQMAAIYRPICVPRRFGKSVRTLRTCPDLLLTISRNFDFRLFRHILVQVQWFIWFDLIFHGNVRHKKNSDA